MNGRYVVSSDGTTGWEHFIYFQTDLVQSVSKGLSLAIPLILPEFSDIIVQTRFKT